jgi:hypothetical protein
MQSFLRIIYKELNNLSIKNLYSNIIDYSEELEFQAGPILLGSRCLIVGIKEDNDVF